MLWLTAGDVNYIHRAQIAEHGGLPGIRDQNALESTLARPRQLHHYQPDATLFQLAASLGFGFARNHVFNDGNKRVAFMAMFVFLGSNGQRLNVQEAEAVSVTLGLAAGDLGEEELVAWLSENTKAWEEGHDESLGI